ncbi:MAG: hypothetical protein ACRBBN_06385 [Methyloligellaceae bacterium]
MKITAMICGLIGGFISLFIGFYGAGVAAATDGSGLDQIMSLSIPVLAIIGGAMAQAKEKIAGILLAISAGEIMYLFGVNIFTGVPFALIAAGAILAFLANDEDTENVA